MPIARLCLRNSIKLSDVIEILKASFVDAAVVELEMNKEEISGSKISVMSGVHRKDVTRLQRSGAELKPEKNVVARVMVAWQQDPRFRTKNGKPRVLNAEGRDSEFAQLVESVTGGDLNSYATLFEMERIGVLSKQGKRVKLRWRDYVSAGNLQEGLGMLADDANDLMSAVEENVYANHSVPNLHLKTEFDNISSAALPKIRQWMLNEGSLLHKRAREFLSQFDLDFNPKMETKTGGARVILGAFSRIIEERV